MIILNEGKFMKFWKKEYNYKIIDNNISDEYLRTVLKQNNIELSIVDNPTEWCAFAHIYGLKHGFNPIHSASFAYMVSMFIGGMGISVGTDAYIKEETIEKELLNIYNEINNEDTAEETKVLKMFDAIVDLYTNRIHLFEYCTEWITFKATPTERELFNKLSGKTAREKFHHLMNLPSE